MKKLFFSLMALFAVCISANAQVEPTDGGIYYLYNTESGNYLSRGSNYGTRAITQPVGMPWKVTVAADGTCKFQMYDLTVAGSTSGYGSNGYSDNGTPIAFTPAGDAKTGYTLANGSKFLDKDGQLTATSTTWQFLTQAQYTAKLAAKATSQESAIATAAGITLGESTLADIVGNTDNYKATTTDDGIPTKETWPVTGVTSRAGSQNEGTSYGEEIYQGGGRFTKTISGLKQGIYKVTVRAMKRVGTNANCYTMGEAGYPVSDAYLDANGYIIPIQSWYEGCTSNSAPNSTGEFMTQVNAGKYKASGYVYVGKDGTMDLKAISEAYWGASWFLFDGIEYVYYSDEVTADDVTALEATIPTTPYDATIATKVNAAKEALDGAKTIANYNALSALIPSATASAAAYASAKATADAAKAKATAVSVDVATAYTAFTTAYNAGTLNGTTEADAVATAYSTALAAKLEALQDVTYKIKNPNFDGNINSWIDTFSGKLNHGFQNNNTYGTINQFMECWAGWWAGSATPYVLPDGKLYQTLARMPEGEYVLTADIIATQQQAGQDGYIASHDEETGIYIFGSYGDPATTFKSLAISQTSDVADHQVAFSFQLACGGAGKTTSLDLGLLIEGTNQNWVAADNFKLYFNGVDKTGLEDLISEASDYATTITGKSYVDDLNTAIGTAKGVFTNDDATKEDVTKAVADLQTALDAAKLAVRIDSYADLADGKYIIAAKEAGTFLGAANSYGTQASLVAHPEYVTLAKQESGKYTIKSQVNNGGDYQYFNGSYMDGDTTEVEIMTTDGGYYLSTDGSQYIGGTTTVASQTDPFVWTITSLADMDAKMAAATEAAPMDVTYKVADPNFGRNNVNWSSLTNTNASKNGDVTNYVVESWHKGAFYLAQTITNLPTGTYELKANAVYTTATETLPYVFANGVKQNFNLTSDTYTAASDYAKSFVDGNYPIDIKVYVQDGQLRIGAKTDDTANNWYVFDNFQLYYLGSAKAKGVENSEFAGNVKINAVDGATENYGTFCAPVDVTMPAGVTAYSVELAEDQATLELAAINGTVEANTPVIVGSETAQCFDNFYTGTVEKAEICGDGILKGVLAPTEVESGETAVYVLQNQDSKVGFYVVNGDEPKTVPANRCYLEMEEEEAPEAKEFYGFGDVETAIKAVNALVSGKAQIYDLNGRQLNKLEKGVNIINGVKVLVK